MTQGYLEFHGEGNYRATIELARSYPELDALREFVTNSLDARKSLDGVQTLDHIDIIVAKNPYHKRLIISDNGVGIDYENKLVKLSSELGKSGKAGMIDMRGEKALGLLAFGSLGESMHIISRSYDNGEYGYLRWEIDKDRISFDHHKLDPRILEREFYGTFPHGTRVIIDKIHPHIMTKLLNYEKLKSTLTKFYNPALIKNIANIKLGKFTKEGRFEVEPIEPMNYEKGSAFEVISDTLKVDIKKEDLPGNLEVLLFVDPEGVYDKVSVYSKDVLVYNSIAELAEFNKSPVWASGKVSGYINDQFNKLILGRSGIERKRNAFKAWYDAVREIEDKIKPIVEENKKREKKVKEHSDIKKIYNALEDVWKELSISGGIGTKYARSSEGEISDVVGSEFTRDGGRNHDLGGSDTRTPGHRPPGPGTFIQGGAYRERVAQKNAFPFGHPQPREFQPNEIRLRSKMADILGTPTPILNSVHPDYQERENLKDNAPFLRYITDLIAKEAANFEAVKSDKKNGSTENKTENIIDVLQREEDIKYLILKKLGIK